jgi:hypothetical protein
MSEPDDDLQAAFQAQRAAERRRAPSYPAGSGRSRARRPRAHRARRLLLTGALAAALGGIAITLRIQASRELELARGVMAVKSPTAFLLETPDNSLLDSIPRFGRSVPGSPLRALDPGGPLGPPLERSPRI